MFIRMRWICSCCTVNIGGLGCEVQLRQQIKIRVWLLVVRRFSQRQVFGGGKSVIASHQCQRCVQVAQVGRQHTQHPSKRAQCDQAHQQATVLQPSGQHALRHQPLFYEVLSGSKTG